MYLALISYLPPLNLPLFPSFLVSPLFLASFLCLRHSHLSFLCISHTNLQTTVWVCSLGLKERGFNTLPTCVCVCVCIRKSTWAALCMHACTPFCLCEIGRYWSEYIWGFNGAELNFHFSYCRKRTRQQDKDRESLSFCSEPTPTPQTQSNKHAPCWRKSVNDVWSSRLW